MKSFFGGLVVGLLVAVIGYGIYNAEDIRDSIIDRMSSQPADASELARKIDRLLDEGGWEWDGKDFDEWIANGDITIRNPGNYSGLNRTRAEIVVAGERATALFRHEELRPLFLKAGRKAHEVWAQYQKERREVLVKKLDSQ